MGKVRVKSRTKRRAGGRSAGGDDEGPAAGSLTEALAASLGQAGSGLAKLASYAGGAYALSGVLDLVSDPLMEAIYGYEGQKLDLAKEEVQERRKATKAMLDFYAREEAEARGERKSATAERLLGMRAAAEEEGMEARTPDMAGRMMEYRSEVTGGSAAARDMLLPVMMQLSRATQTGDPISPLLAAGIAL